MTIHLRKRDPAQQFWSFARLDSSGLGSVLRQLAHMDRDCLLVAPDVAKRTLADLRTDFGYQPGDSDMPVEVIDLAGRPVAV